MRDNTGGASGPTVAAVPTEDWLVAAVDRHHDLVVAIDPAFCIVYANVHAHELVGAADGDLLGRSIADFVHPDDLGRAAEVVEEIMRDELGVSVTPATYRIRDAKGVWRPLEINASAPVPHPDGERILIVGRYSGDHDLQDQIVEHLISGAPVEEAIDLIPAIGLWRHPEEHYGVIFTDDRGERCWRSGSPLLDLVGRHLESGPWNAAMTTGEDVLVEDAATLDEPIRSEAMALGLGPLWVRPVEDPHGGERAAVVAWCGSSRPNNAFHRYALGRMEKALALVLLWRHKLVGLRRAASEDSLTGLANRAAFFEALGAACDAATRSGHAVGVLYIDLDGFKSVNDQHGHMRGDHLLAAVAGRIAGAVRGGATVGRLGGDEFGVLVPEAPDPTLLDDMAERVLHALTDPVTVGARSIQPAASIGSATSATAGLDPDGLVDAADRALYVAKREGRGRWARHEA